MKVLRTDKAPTEKLAEIFCKNYKIQRKFTPEMTEKFERVEEIAPKIEKAFSKKCGVIALENDEIIGYIAGFPVEKFKSRHKGIVVPEWAHGAVDNNKKLIYSKMYEKVSEIWMENEAVVHAFQILSYDEELIGHFNRMNFGCHAEDGVRSPEPLNIGKIENIEIKPLEKSLINDVVELDKEFTDYMRKPPVFFPDCYKYNSEEYYEDWLEKDDRIIYMAYVDNEPAGYFQALKANPGGSTLVVDEKTFAINGAFVREEYRKNKVSVHLLDAVLRYGKDNGYHRCTVDYETYNPSGSNFWLKHFKPFSTSVIRYVDNRNLK